MQNILNKLMQKRKIEKMEDMSEDEKATFNKWNEILSTKEITIDNLQAFLEELKNKAIKDVAEEDNTIKKDAKCKASITICEALLGLITTPKVERENLEKYLNTLLD